MKEMCTSKAKAAITAVFWRSTQRIRPAGGHPHPDSLVVALAHNVCGLVACTCCGLQLSAKSSEDTLGLVLVPHKIYFFFKIFRHINLAIHK
jgi:hypothetical protein